MSNVGVHTIEAMGKKRQQGTVRAHLQRIVENKKTNRTEQAAIRAERQRRAVFAQEAIPHMDALYNFALRLTKEKEDASDLLQETYLKAYRFFDKFQRGTNCKAWLFRIMKNSYINRYRKTQKLPESIDFDSVSDFYHSIKPQGETGNDLQLEVFDQLLGDQVVLAVEQLPSDFRTVVILCDLEDFTYEEIADFVDCPVGTVRSRLHRGRRLLRQYLADYAQEEGYNVV